MRKSDKKLDNQLCRILTEACETLQEKQPGFVWLTHQADYKRFPESLMITCVFDTVDSQQQALQPESQQLVGQILQQNLSEMGLYILHIHKHFQLDNEEQPRTGVV